MSIQRSPITTRASAALAESSQSSRLVIVQGIRQQHRRIVEELCNDLLRRTEATPETRSQIKQTLDRLKDHEPKLRDLNERVLNHEDLPPDSVEAELNQLGDDERRRSLAASYAQMLLEGLEHPPSGLTQASGHATERTASPERRTSVAPIVITAPPIDIAPEPYAGEPCQFRNWFARFQNYIGRRPSARGVDKLEVLTKCLTGSARALIERLELTDNNFDVAVQILKNNFGAASLERQTALAEITALPTARSANDTAALRRLINQAEGCILTLEALDCPLRQYALNFENSLRAALPQKIVFEQAEAQLLSTGIEENNPLSNEATSSASADTREREDDSATTAARRMRRLLDYVTRYTNHRETLEAMSTLTSARGPSTNDKHPYHRGDATPGGARGYRERLLQRSNRHPPVHSYKQTCAASLQHPRPKQRHPIKCFFCNKCDHMPSSCPATIAYNERARILDQKGKCHVCFRAAHRVPQSCEGPKVPCSLCNSRSHYRSIHPSVTPNSTTAACDQLTAVPHHSDREVPSPILMHTACAYILNGSDRIPVKIFLDTGSSVSFIKPSAVKQLIGATPVRSAKFKLQTLSDVQCFSALQYNVRLVSTYEEDREPIELLVYSHEFNINPRTFCTTEARKALRQFELNHRLADRSLTEEFPVGAPAILLGLDQIYKVAKLNSEVRVSGGLVAKNTHLGWTIGGQLPTNAEAASVCVQDVCCAATFSNSAKAVDRLWSLEAIGIQEAVQDSPLSADEEDATRQFDQGLAYDGLRYTVALPKRHTINSLANNSGTARRRLHNKLRSLQKDPAILQRYDKEIMAFVEDGHAELVTTEPPLPGARDGSYYMPHHQVVTQRGNDAKWRIVFDCSSAAKGESSLNAHLLSGPNINPDLITLLLNFRLRRVALSADITRAYMMLGLAKEDRPLFRFLWKRPHEAEVKCYQMTRVTWGAAPSGYLLAATLRTLRPRQPQSTTKLVLPR